MSLLVPVTFLSCVHFPSPNTWMSLKDSVHRTLHSTHPWSQTLGPSASFLQMVIAFWKVVLLPSIFRSRFLVVITIPGLFPPSAPHTWLDGHWSSHTDLNLQTDFISAISSVFTSPPLPHPACLGSGERHVPPPSALPLPQCCFYRLCLEFISQSVASSLCFLPSGSSYKPLAGEPS